jgi:hypothetical protein
VPDVRLRLGWEGAQGLKPDHFGSHFRHDLSRALIRSGLLGIFPQVVTGCAAVSLSRVFSVAFAIFPGQSKSGRSRAIPGLKIETRASLHST